MITTDEWELVQKLVNDVCRDVARKWPDTIVADDIEQDVMLLLLESPGTARKILDGNPKFQKQTVWILGHREAGKQLTQYEHFTGQYNYSVDEVRSLLEEGVLTEDVEGHYEEIIDLVEALSQMTADDSVYVDPILIRYADGVIPERDSAARKTLNRAVTSLTEYMNRSHRKRLRDWTDGPGSRKVGHGFDL